MQDLRNQEITVLNITNNDLDLTVKCKDFNTTFEKAKKKHDNILTATSYKITEGKLLIYNSDSNNLIEIDHAETYPIFFENKDYFFEITFEEKNEIRNPYIYSRLREIENKFFYKEKSNLLSISGTINFGNDLGKSNLILRYTKNKIQKEFNFQFEVFPTKLNYKSDYNKIIADIEKEYSYLVLDFLKKTYASFKTGNSSNTDLIWWQIFGGLYKDFIKSSYFILNKPHSKIIKLTRYEKADKIKNWTSTLEEQYAEFKHLPKKLYTTEYKTLSTNTTENKFFKSAVFQTKRRYKNVKSFIENHFKYSITESFQNEMNTIEKELNTLAANPFFNTIDDFKGINQESLVLQKATGYSTIYKSWIMLNSGLKFLNGIQNIELKNIADLYQIWCFLEIKSILQRLLNKTKPDDIELSKILIDGFIFKIEQGIESKVSFKTSNGENVSLFHNLSFSACEKDKKVRSFTVNQKPDIVLNITKNDLKDNYVLTYLYDAKYRLASDEKEDFPDSPTEDSINQMHRYRDAIYYINKDKNRPEKEVIGAYILFPGSGNIETIKELDYYKSITTVNIGAFPLQPNDSSNRQLLENHLKTLIGIDTEAVLNNVPPQKEHTYESPNPYVLIGFVPTKEHMLCFTENDKPFYYSGSKKPTRFGFNNLKYFAPYIKEMGIKEYFEIIDYQIMPRKDIFKPNHPLFKKDTSERLVISLGKKFTIDNEKFFKISDGSIGQVPYRYTNLRNIRAPKNNKIEVLNLSNIENS